MFGTIVSVIIAFTVAWFIFRTGVGLLRSMATPLPEPPPAGELRRVKIGYRCPICGSEVRMTIATDQEPEAPRHCMAEMDLMAPIE